MQGTVKGGRRQGGQRKRWEDNIREWTGLEFGKSQRAVENREKLEKTGCKIICGAPTILVVKRLMMMMNMAPMCKPTTHVIFYFGRAWERAGGAGVVVRGMGGGGLRV